MSTIHDPDHRPPTQDVETKQRQQLRSAVYYDIKAQYDLYGGRSRLRRFLRSLLTPGVQTMITFRFGTWLISQSIGVRCLLHPVYAVMHALVLVFWGIDVERGATIGPGLYIGHFGGINISSAATIGSNCFISQSVTIGVAGHGDRRGAPHVGNNVYIAPGARLFGKITVGDDSKIGANCVIHKDVPAGATVVTTGGCEILSIYGKRIRDQAQESPR